MYRATDKEPVTGVIDPVREVIEEPAYSLRTDRHLSAINPMVAFTGPALAVNVPLYLYWRLLVVLLFVVANVVSVGLRKRGFFLSVPKEYWSFPTVNSCEVQL